MRARFQSKVRVEEASARFDVDVLQGLVPGSCEKLPAMVHLVSGPLGADPVFAGG